MPAVSVRFCLPVIICQADVKNYSGNLWTIPVEFKGSVLVFVLLLALIRVRTWIRLTVVGVSTCWLISREDFDMGLFTGGVTESPHRPLGTPLALVSRRERHRRLSHPLRHASTLGSFFVSLWLTAYPQDNGQKSPWYQTLSQATPTVLATNEEARQFF